VFFNIEAQKFRFNFAPFASVLFFRFLIYLELSREPKMVKVVVVKLLR